MNGLLMPPGFPTTAFDALYQYATLSRGPYAEEFLGAWNAISYRYRALLDYSDGFEASIKRHGPAPEADIRFKQEKDLFGFFSNAFSVFEAYFFGMYALGAELSPASFPFTTSQDRQRVTINSTIAGYKKTWPDHPIIMTFEELSNDPVYRGLRDARNVLTHRTAPGRTIYADLSNDGPPTADWKLLNSPLDEHTTRARREGVTRMLWTLTAASQSFVETRGSRNEEEFVEGAGTASQSPECLRL
ncbi:hypothetical protein KQX64_23340 [Rhodopseudomonas palustris]|nr:hypothetical protein KQX64_23340 [Rhodopseudomonas palustris]